MSDDIQANEKIVRCADEMREVCRRGLWWRSVAMALVILASMGIASAADAAWVFPAGVAVAIVAFVVPHVLQIHLGYTRLRCPSCGREAGAYESKRTRTYLVCKHCGEKTPTDCGGDCEGGVPFKIE